MDSVPPFREIIRKKRDGTPMSADEFRVLAEGAATSQIPDYQLSAWLMAAYFQTLNAEEVYELTLAIKNTGRSLDWNALGIDFPREQIVDKHSTGGVGDKVSIVLAPILASLGLKVPMMSGRSLGHTGGTVDKLESIPGFSMYPDTATMIKCIKELGLCMMAQAEDLCPADRKLYALRDVTATVENIPLITASILSKKWAEGVGTLLFDVKCGEGAFMAELPQAQGLAASLIRVAKMAGIQSRAAITRMEEPLGSMVGNSLEIKECLSILRSEGMPATVLKLKTLIFEQASLILQMARPELSSAQADTHVQEACDSGRAYEVFEKMCSYQGADSSWESELPQPVKVIECLSPASARVSKVHSRVLGDLGLELGVGRRVVSERIDPAAGFEVLCFHGEVVDKGQPLLKIYLGESGLRQNDEYWIQKSLKAINLTEDTASAKRAVEMPLLMEVVG